MPLLIARSLDIVLDNRIERVQALRLVRKLLCIDPQQFPRALTNCLVAIANDGVQERDILVKACLAALSELALLNPESCANSGGLSAILRNVLDNQQPQIDEALIGVVLFLLNDPKTRHLLGSSITLEQILAPFTDCHFKFSADISDHFISDDKEARFACSKLAIISILRSWPGLIYLCRPDHAGLQSLIDMLYLPYNDIRKNIMDILYEVFCLPIPEWTDDFSTAVLSSDPSTMRDSWHIYEGFVASEGNSILSPVIKYRTNLVENYFALLLLTFVQTGLLEALVDVVTADDNFISVRAVILLGELLHMANQLLPSECSHHCNCLPTLISMATSFESSPHRRNQASTAISYLNQIHVLKKRDVVPCSLFLDQLLHFCNPIRKKDKHFGDTISRTKLWHYLRKDADDMISQAIKDSQVTIRDYTDWDWELIGSLLKNLKYLHLSKLWNLHLALYLEMLLYDLVGITSHDLYIKLVVSSLDYTKDGFSRKILTKVLTSTNENARLYATNYLRVLMRARIIDFHKWAIELLITQLYDPCRAVSLAAADILDEACDVQENLEALISLRPPLLHYGDKGLLLLLRFLSVSGGFRFLRDANFLNHELHKWHNTYNLKYVKIVEEYLNEALTCHHKGEDGTYGRRSSNVRREICTAFIPPHMYGQLVRHKEGLELLLNEDCLSPLYDIIKTANYVSESNILHLKAALWAIGHVGMSSIALPTILEANVVPQIIKLAQEASVFSIRGTCFYVLGLLSSTPEGADLLMQYGWETVRRAHDDKWPIVLNTTTLDEFPQDDCRSYTWSVSSGDSEWLECLSSSFSFVVKSENETLSQFQSLPSSYSLDLDDSVIPINRHSVKWNKDYGEGGMLPSVQTLPFINNHQPCQTRPRSSSDCRSNTNPLYKLECDSLDKEKSLSRPEVVWKIGSNDVIKDRSSSFGGTQDATNENSVKERSISDLEVSNKKETIPQYSLGTKGLRSSSNESSHTSKSRSGSSTDSTTSGISSCDSAAPRLYHSDHAQTLSPIASSTSLNTMSNRSTSCLDHIHGSMIMKQSYVNRSMSYIYNPSSPDGTSCAFSFTSARDALGYVTLKDIQRKRIQSMSFDEEKSNWLEKRNLKSQSLEPNLLNCQELGFDCLDLTENIVSCKPSASSQSSTLSSSVGKSSEVSSEVLYIGLSLPVDYRMILSLHECQECGTCASDTQNDERETLNIWKMPENQSSNNGLVLHSTNNCLVCKKWYTLKKVELADVTTDETDEDNFLENRELSSPCESKIENEVLPLKCNDDVKTMNVSVSSLTSPSSTETKNYVLNEESSFNTSMIYKEIMRFVTNMSSSIALKSSEQGLLNLKQKFPKIFQDICLYTEISLYLANYSFRLGARRFLQELFWDASFHEIYTDAEALLETIPKTVSLPTVESSET
ncbi:rapamycin-insensitive companion of mTOR-like [Centruroides sculpturatus]|uniref:rapamycin-insensitive companion of mTOR-like n=1 Tax=Centruroides sculpturatus TaxID=218467 RepID=UPI000C6EB7EF|nr:rapamycin-insensitive companion of mTOR-like [Centruroides sculpturatus]